MLHDLFFEGFRFIFIKIMRKKQITSPTKITVKQSPMIAKFGPQQVIISDTSIRNNEDNDQSSGTNNHKWQKNNKIIQERASIETGWKKSKSPQGLQYNAGWKSMSKSPRENAPLERDNSWKQAQSNKKQSKSMSYDEERNINSNQLGVNNIKGSKKAPNQRSFEAIEEENAPRNNKPQDYRGAHAEIDDMIDDQNEELVEKQYTFSNGDVYLGHWKGKWMEGYGVYNFNKQNLQYRGQFKKSKQHGTGVLLRKPGGTQIKEEEIYDGQWMNGQKHGLGKYYYFKDVFYDGNWVRNKKEGHGMFKSPEGQYVGSWKNDKKDGKGILKLKNGHTFQGSWIMNEFLEGTLTHSNGDRYEGEFQNFNRHGYGTYFYSNKSKYRGYWQNNQKHGQGQVQYFNGDTYQGPMAQNNRQGNDAHYRWQSGQEMIGEFRGDAPIRGKIRLPSQGQSEFNLLKTG